MEPSPASCQAVEPMSQGPHGRSRGCHGVRGGWGHHGTSSGYSEGTGEGAAALWGRGSLMHVVGVASTARLVTCSGFPEGVPVRVRLRGGDAEAPRVWRVRLR